MMEAQQPNTEEVKIEQQPISETIKFLRENFNKNKTKSYEWRYNQLNQLKKMILNERKKWEDALKKDLKSTSFVIMNEVDSSVKEVSYIMSNLKNWMKPENRPISYVSYRPGTAQIYKEPYGLVLIIAPWNYPVSLIVKPLAGAIAAGNAVVIKPSEVSESVSAVFGELVPKYLDKECIACIEGGVQVATDLLKEKWDYIFYTGSTAVGKIVMKAAAEHLTPVTLELGGKSPTIIDINTNIEVASRRIVMGKFLNCGQTCVAPDYILCHKDIEEQFCEQLKKTIIEFFGEDAQQSSDYSRIINERHVQRLEKILVDDKNKIWYGGKVDVNDRYIQPTIMRNVTEDDQVMKEEIFGPILPILKIDSIQQAVQFINSKPKPLALYIYSNDTHVQEYVLENTSSGGACVNDSVIHVALPTLPFGGVGDSGMGSYNGESTFKTFSHEKSVLKKKTWPDVAVRYPPWTQSKVDWINYLNQDVSGLIWGSSK